MTGRPISAHELRCPYHQHQYNNDNSSTTLHQHHQQQVQQQVISVGAPPNGSSEHYAPTTMLPNNDTDSALLATTASNFRRRQDNADANSGDSLTTMIANCLARSPFSLYDAATLLTLLFALRYLLHTAWRQYHSRAAYDPEAGELSRLPLPPGSFGLPIIGETLSWLRLGTKFNSSRRKKYGNLFSTNVLLMPMVKVTGHEYVKEILRGEHTKVTTIWPRSVRHILGEHGLVNSTSAIHRFKRRISSRAFTREALDGYLVAMRDISAANVAVMATYECPKVYDMMLRQTFDIAVNALLGLDVTSGVDGVGDLDELFVTFNNLVSNIFCVPYKIPYCGYVKGMNAREKILQLLHGYIERKKNWLKEEVRKGAELGEDGRKYIEGGSGAVDIIIREEMIHKLKMRKEQPEEEDDGEFEIDNLTMKEMAIELMFAGYFTSASAITSCILELALNPEVFRKLERELQQFGFINPDLTSSSSCDQVPVDSGTINRMTYLDKVVKETLRLRPPVLGAYRRALKTFQIGDYRIPKGWMVIYNIRDTHEFESGTNQQFDPENFDKNTSGHKHSYIPFGGGSRMCIGQEYARLIIKITIINMMRQYRKWELVSDRSLKMKAIPTLHPCDGLPVKLFPRAQPSQQQQQQQHNQS